MLDVKSHYTVTRNGKEITIPLGCCTDAELDKIALRLELDPAHGYEEIFGWAEASDLRKLVAANDRDIE